MATTKILYFFPLLLLASRLFFLTTIIHTSKVTADHKQQYFRKIYV